MQQVDQAVPHAIMDDGPNTWDMVPTLLRPTYRFVVTFSDGREPVVSRTRVDAIGQVGPVRPGTYAYNTVAIFLTELADNVHLELLEGGWARVHRRAMP